ncbi:MAG: glycosyltransferase [Lachnospiraceae bacterium]|nr:glycosyltransferase [Lachnospiraceae bacterium]
MNGSETKMITILVNYLAKLKDDLEGDIHLEDAAQRVGAIPPILDKISDNIVRSVLEPYKEYFDGVRLFYDRCRNVEFLDANLQDAYDSIILLIKCLGEIIEALRDREGRCPCCGARVVYLPLPSYYQEMKEKYGITYNAHAETLNKEKYLCPSCQSSDRDRMIVSFLEKIGLSESPEGTKVLQIAPAHSIDNWIKEWCPNIVYDTTDLFMDGVTFRTDIQDMKNVENGTYDLIICSHVLEHVQDDRKALSELKRVLKEDGEIVFLVPVDLNRDDIDEEWGLSEEENWKRFGQGDHCRAYSKEGLIERLREQFFVHQLGKEYFGETVFEQCGLADTSILYVLSKDENVDLHKGWIPVIDQDLCQNGPLVSVLLPTYNHEKYVERAIESVLNQSYKNLEILVADDGSTDRTPEICRKYSKYFAKEYYFEENLRGRAEFLATQATGKYVALMHSDDVWDKDKIAIQVKELEEKGGISLTWALCINDDGEIEKISGFVQKNRSRDEWLQFFWEYGNCICNPSLVMPRELFMKRQKHGWSCKQLPDYFKWIDYVQETELHIVQYPLTQMGIHYSGYNANDSAPTVENKYRHLLEDGIHWMTVLQDMEDDIFLSAFGKYFRKQDASTKEELMCEKYFLMLDSDYVARQGAAINYMSINFLQLRDCLKEKYNYLRNDFYADEVKKGFIPLLLSQN